MWETLPNHIDEFVRQYGSGYLLMPHFVSPTPNTKIWRAKWTAKLKSHTYEACGYVVTYVSRDGHRAIYHARTFRAALKYLDSVPASFERLRELVQRSAVFKREFARALGWCDPGISNWASKKLGIDGASQISVVTLWNAVKDDTADYHSRILRRLLEGHPELTKPQA